MHINTCFIEFLNASKNFQKDIVYFEGIKAYVEAIAWGQSNLENFNRDMIKYEYIK